MMAQTIDKNQLSEFSPHKFTTEASDLGLHPGQWPKTLIVEPTMGNGQPFQIQRANRDGEGGLQSVVYMQVNGCQQIEVFND